MTAPLDLPKLLRGKSAAKALTRLRKAWETLGIDAEREAVNDRLEDLTAPLLLFVVGEGKFGKSSLINALLGVPAAPVSVLPCTWRIDIYQSSSEGAGAIAELRWRSREELEVLDHAAALQIIAEQEQHARDALAAHTPQSFVSDLVQVRWRSPEFRLPPDVALVDTPGFSQLRSDVAIADAHIRSAQGIRITAKEAFEYWYHRADVVVWLFKATRLNDRDTELALARLAKHGRTILGAVTHMDRVPPEQHSEVMTEAQKLFGAHVQGFFPVVGKPGMPGHEDTIAVFADAVVNKFFSSAREHKQAALAQFLQRSGDRVINWAAKENEAMLRNLDVLRKTRSALRAVAEGARPVLAAATEAWVQASTATAMRRCEGAFKRLPADDKELQAEMLKVLRPTDACGVLAQQVEAVLTTVVADLRRGSQRLDLVGVQLSDEGAEVFVQAPDLEGAITHQVDGTGMTTRVQDIVSGFEGVGTGIGLGAVGAVLLGPIGWGLAIAGLLMGDEIKMNKMREATKNKIGEWFPATAQRSLDMASATCHRMYDSTDHAVLDAFTGFCGALPKEVEGRCLLYERQVIRKLAVRRPTVVSRLLRAGTWIVVLPFRVGAIVMRRLVRRRDFDREPGQRTGAEETS